MFDWVDDLISGIGDAIGNALAAVWNTISSGIFDIFFKWIYKLIFDGIADFFTMMGNLGTELFNLPWVESCLKFFSLFGWALFITGLVVAVFDTAVEYQSMERINIKRQILPFLYGFLAVNLFTIVPIRLYSFSISIQGTLMKDLSAQFAGTQSVGTNLFTVATAALSGLSPSIVATGGLLNLFFLIALGYCVIKIFFANIKRSGMLLTQIGVGSLYMFSIPKGNTEGFVQWMRQVIALCVTAFMQMTLLYLGLLTWKENMLLGLGVMLAAGEVPNIAKQFGLDTSVKVNMMSAVHTTTTAINLGRAIAKK